MTFDGPVRTVVPWPQSGLHMQDPVGRYGVEFVIADISPRATSADTSVLRAVLGASRPSRSPIVSVEWGPHMLAVYRASGAKPVLDGRPR
jgi:hypothetical protein